MVVHTENSELIALFEKFDDNLFIDPHGPATSLSYSNRPTKGDKKLLRFKNLLEKRKSKRTEEHRRRNRRQPIKLSSQRSIPELEVAIDLTFCHLMSVKENRKLTRQLGRVWGLQKSFVGLNSTLLYPSTSLLNECRAILTGFDEYKWRIFSDTNTTIKEAYPMKKLVYFAPDKDLLPLLELDQNAVYIIGGLVDESGIGRRSSKRAEICEVECRRLPIPEFMKKSPNGGTYNTTLTINQVIEILCLFAWTGDWLISLRKVVPSRTGYC